MKKSGLLIEIGLLIKKYRLNYPLSQEELSFRVNINRNQISLIERGIAEPRAVTLISLMKVLNIPVSEIERLKTLLKISEIK